MRKFSSILIANRGEIAVRIIRTAKSLGYRTISIYSEADKGSLHVTDAHESYLIGKADLKDSYLNQDKILELAKSIGAEAIHPGYGLLSENPGFAKACKERGIVFIGPSHQSIELMGDKAAAKRHMEEAGVPCIPGYNGKDQSLETLLKESKKIGYPLMVKASAGGGGKGIRLVNSEKELLSSIKLSKSEALSSFGDDTLILEKAIKEPRHVEIQVFGDHYKNYLHLGERDCSIQRRHQKIIEESPGLNESMRKELGEAAIKAAKSINYLGAGTLEFLVSGNDFYFMEMNTRLQVEHTVTEMITGLDLVALQIDVAQGKKLSICQSDVKLRGHAIEVRLYAEDPSKDFMPDAGRVLTWEPTPNARVDTSLVSGQEISPFYDPLLAKIITWGCNRDDAINKMCSALRETLIFGVRTNKDFLIKTLNRDEFVEGTFSTNFISNTFKPAELTEDVDNFLIAALAQFLWEREECFKNSAFTSSILKNWSSGPQIMKRYKYLGETYSVTFVDDLYHLTGAGKKLMVSIDHLGDGYFKAFANSVALEVRFLRDNNTFHVSINGHEGIYNNQISNSSLGENTVDGQIVSPMHGTLLEILVKEGQSVRKGQSLAVVEAMKMQNEITSKSDGVVKRIYGTKSSQVAMDFLIMEISPSNSNSSMES